MIAATPRRARAHQFPASASIFMSRSPRHSVVPAPITTPNTGGADFPCRRTMRTPLPSRLGIRGRWIMPRIESLSLVRWVPVRGAHRIVSSISIYRVPSGLMAQCHP